MEAIDVVLFFLCVFGISTIISTEYVFHGLVSRVKNKHLYVLLSCNKCLSVWFGALFSILGFGFSNPVVDALCAYSVTYLINGVYDALSSFGNAMDAFSGEK